VPREILLARAYLSRVAEPPATAVARLVERVGPVRAAALVRRGAEVGPDALDADVLSATRARRETDRAEADLALLADLGGRLLVPEDPGWPTLALCGFAPAAARGIEDMVAPLALWTRGPLDLADAPRSAVAMVGARAASDYGVWVARDWAAGLADRGLRVVSGAALGIDGAALRGALAAGGETLAVLACGIDRPYPPTHTTLIAHLAERGLVVSEYPPGVTPGRHRFLVRNRLVAALAAGTLVVEAAARSGAMRTAVVARELGRALMVVPGPVTSALSLGCHELARREGTSVVGRVEHVVEEVGAVGDDLAPLPWSPARPTDGLDADTLAVHEAFPFAAARTAERLAEDSGVDPRAIATHLTDLEARGLVWREGDRWRRRLV
jgi:DNA processing protein